MDDQEFRVLFHKIADQYALAPDLAEELLQRILAVLTFCNLPNKSS